MTDLLEATWPAAKAFQIGPWTIRDGQNGGKRASATTARAPWQDEEIEAAEAAMAQLGQPLLFRIGPNDVMLDQALQSRGYRIVDPVLQYRADIDQLAALPQHGHSAMAHWPMLQICRRIWEDSGVTPARQAVMERVTGPKAVMLGRFKDRVAGCCFIAAHDNAVMLHALDVLPEYRRQSIGRNIMIGSARWAQNIGATELHLLVTRANLNARRFYDSLGMQVIEEAHYRQR